MDRSRLFQAGAARPGLLLLAMLVAALSLWAWARNGEHDNRNVAPRAVPITSNATEQRNDARATAPSVQDETAPPELLADGALLARTRHKYRFLLADLSARGAAVDAIEQLLLERESAAQARAEGNDENLDAPIRALLLTATEQDYYAALATSDSEQQHLAEYMGGISNVEPLSERQERAVLEARLRHKQRYEATVRDAGLDREMLAPAERLHSHALLVQALQDYRDNFLIEIAPTLTEQQHELLSSYEATEFSRELERLQRQINSK